MGGVGTPSAQPCIDCGVAAQTSWDGWATSGPWRCKKCEFREHEQVKFKKDPDLELRLVQARGEGVFEQHLRQVFGDRHVEFTVNLRDRLRELWTLALRTRTGDDMTVKDEEDFLRKGRAAFDLVVRATAIPEELLTAQPGPKPRLTRERSGRVVCQDCRGTGFIAGLLVRCAACKGVARGPRRLTLGSVRSGRAEDDSQEET